MLGEHNKRACKEHVTREQQGNTSKASDYRKSDTDVLHSQTPLRHRRIEIEMERAEKTG